MCGSLPPLCRPPSVAELPLIACWFVRLHVLSALAVTLAFRSRRPHAAAWFAATMQGPVTNDLTDMPHTHTSPTWTTRAPKHPA